MSQCLGMALPLGLQGAEADQGEEVLSGHSQSGGCSLSRTTWLAPEGNSFAGLRTQSLTSA